MIVGLTGGISTGKTTVTEMLRELGAYVIDADVWARKVVEPGSIGFNQIVHAFGADILESDGTLSRPKLGQKIFHDKAARELLNDITHPLVREGMKNETRVYLQSRPDEPVVWDVPLLFEGETRNLVDKTILVYVDESIQCKRLMARNRYSEPEARARITSQMPIEQKKQLADYVIDNRGTLDETREQVQTVWQIIRGLQSEDPESSY